MKKIKKFIISGIIYSLLRYYGFEPNDIVRFFFTVLNKIKQIKSK